MNAILKKLKNISSENCITIIMNSHRTKPDYLKDDLTLKNLIKEVESRLLADTTKQEATILVDRLKNLAKEIDHSHNLESLLLFVNKDVAEFTRLPIAVTDRVIIDSTFATRDLVRAMNEDAAYYILVLSQEKARLIEAFNNKVVKELNNPFPIENEQYFTSSKTEAAVASRRTNFIAEFFNTVDKEVNKIRKENPLPVLICALEENHGEYLKIADEKHSILNTFLNKNKIADTDHSIVAEVWQIKEAYVKNRNNQRKADLLKAVTENKFLSDTNEIWKAIHAGRVQTLFIEKGLFQPAILDNDEVVFVSEDHKTNTDVIDDIYDEMIEFNMSFGGDVVFLPKGELKKFNGFGAITRY